jgi:hypothetical protein
MEAGRIDEHREFWRSLVDWLATAPRGDYAVTVETAAAPGARIAGGAEAWAVATRAPDRSVAAAPPALRWVSLVRAAPVAASGGGVPPLVRSSVEGTAAGEPHGSPADQRSPAKGASVVPDPLRSDGWALHGVLADQGLWVLAGVADDAGASVALEQEVAGTAADEPVLAAVEADANASADWARLALLAGQSGGLVGSPAIVSAAAGEMAPLAALPSHGWWRVVVGLLVAVALADWTIRRVGGLP